MPRFFFDIHNNGVMRDDEGHLLPNVEAARVEALRALPEITASELPSNGDRQHYAMVVRDEQGQAVYTASLTYMGLRL